jgi:hypothetical protein
MKQEYLNRIRSLAWRALMMALAVFLQYLALHIAELNISGSITVIVGLILGEISKFLNIKYGFQVGSLKL